MRKLIFATLTMCLSILLVSCSNESPENKQSDEKSESADKTSTSDKGTPEKNKNDHKQNDQQANQENANASNQKTEQSANEEKSILDDFSTNEIEYARVWNQLGPLKNNMDGMNSLNVKQIPKGSKVNPQASDSAVYKEDVVKLEAPMRAGGSVTYSSNGDGTVNVYKNVPYDWRDANVDADTKSATTKAIEKNIETVTISPGDDQTIADLAKKVKYSN
ncbi:hypothetical protein [Staphylococcus caeli]|uniref:hypothetical protein n=1 Tax=Staphylococcus caeli TaxID=2201815 RepID=UPI003F55C9D1